MKMLIKICKWGENLVGKFISGLNISKYFIYMLMLLVIADMYALGLYSNLIFFQYI